MTTDSAWRVSRPCMRMTTASHGPSRPPTTISASRRDSVCGARGRGRLRTTMSSRHGCAAAAVAAAVSASRTRFSSTTATRVSASPLATPPALRRSADSALTTSLPVVSHSAIMVPRRSAGIVTAAARPGRRGPASRRRPGGPTRRRGR